MSDEMRRQNQKIMAATVMVDSYSHYSNSCIVPLASFLRLKTGFLRKTGCPADFFCINFLVDLFALPIATFYVFSWVLEDRMNRVIANSVRGSLEFVKDLKQHAFKNVLHAFLLNGALTSNASFDDTQYIFMY